MKNTLIFIYFKKEKKILHYFIHLIYFKNNSIKSFDEVTLYLLINIRKTGYICRLKIQN